MTPRNLNPFNYPTVQTYPGWDVGTTIDRGFDTTEDEVAEFGLAAFEDRVQVEARHLKEDWA